MIDVGGNDRAAARDFAADEFGRHEFRDFRPEAFAVGDGRGCVLDRRLAREILAMRDIDHLFGDDPGAGELELGDELVGVAGAQRTCRGAERREMIRRDGAVILRADRAAFDRGVAARRDPTLADRGEAVSEIDPRCALGVGTRRVIDPDRRLLRIAKRDLAERHADVGVALRRGVDLAGADDRPGGDGLGRGEFRNLVHGRLLVRIESDGRNGRHEIGLAAATSLRRHDPDQVQRVRRLAVSAPYGTPLEQARNLGLET